MFGGPIDTLLLAVVLVVAVAVWLLRRRRPPGPRLLAEDDAIDRETLEAAEREVRDLGSRQDPEDNFDGDDWGPGTARRPRSPLEL